jgi:osmotically-inducible protein OsmY
MNRNSGLLKTMVFGALAFGAGVPALAQPTPETDQDQRQAAQIQARLQKDPELQNNQIGVTVDRGVATLTGRVDTATEKSDAARLALVSGIVGVDNRLDVGSSGVKQTVIDSATTAKIKGRLTEAGLQEFGDVSVTTNNGVVTLTGVVPSADAAAQVVRLVRHAEGVTRVENHLTVAPPRR